VRKAAFRIEYNPFKAAEERHLPKFFLGLARHAHVDCASMPVPAFRRAADGFVVPAAAVSAVYLQRQPKRFAQPSGAFQQQRVQLYRMAAGALKFNKVEVFLDFDIVKP